MSETVLILGSTSGIARALARRLAAGGARLVLAARDPEGLADQVADLEARSGAEVAAEPFDALDLDGLPELFRRCLVRAGGAVDGVVLAHGVLPDQLAVQSDPAAARRSLEVNLTSAVVLLGLAADHLEARGNGWIAAISSVAGDRGRQSNYVYGCAKAGLSAFLSGLRNRLARRNVHVLTVKPGFVDTAMTRGLVKPGSPLVASPDRVSRDIERAIRRRRNVLYTPWFWRPIMLVVRLVPEPLFKRLGL